MEVHPAPAPPSILPTSAPISPPAPPALGISLAFDPLANNNAVSPLESLSDAKKEDTTSPLAIGGEPGPLPPKPGSSKQTLGKEPRSYNLEFLRRQTVLLRPGEWQWDVGISYLYAENDYTDIVGTLLVETRVRQRLLLAPIEFRYGLFERVQLFVNVPFGWTNTEVSYLGADAFLNDGGIGDTNFGASILLWESNGYGYSPDIVATLGVTAATGEDAGVIGLFETPQTSLGRGYWAGLWNILFIHQYDPVILFYGFGGRHYCMKDINGVSTKPGDEYLYQFGAGFAANERITFSTTFYGSYITEPWINNQPYPGAILEPMYLRCEVTIMRSANRIVEPFIEFGLTDDAARAHAGITWTF